MINSLNRVHAQSPFGNVLRFFLGAVPKSYVATVRMGINKGAKWVVGSSIHRCWLGSYEQGMQEMLPQIIRPGMVIWDVGANAGFYTLAFSRLTGETGRVYAFEPEASNAAKLQRHIRLNGLTNTHQVQCALSDRTGMIGFDPGVSHQTGFLSQEAKDCLVPTISADEFLALYPESAPDLMKIDIEGAESGMLEGALRLLGSRRPTLILALHGDVQRTKCYELLTRAGYTVKELDGRLITDPLLCDEEVLAVPASPAAVPADGRGTGPAATGDVPALTA